MNNFSEPSETALGFCHFVNQALSKIESRMMLILAFTIVTTIINILVAVINLRR
jgi:hypothetical protein